MRRGGGPDHRQDFERRVTSEDGGKDGGLTVKEFLSEYVAKSKPVLIRSKDARGLLKDWRAWDEWSRKGLTDKYGQIEVNISSSSSIVALREGGDNDKGASSRLISKAKLGDFIGEAMGRDAADATALADKDPPYLFRTRQLPGLADDYTHSPFFDDIEIFHHDMLTREKIALLFVGPGNSGAYFHQHMSANNALIYGAKHWYLLPPQASIGDKGWETAKSMPAWVEEIMPKLDVKPLQCVQHAGEIAYVPTLWWHGIVNLCDSVGVALEVGLERDILINT